MSCWCGHGPWHYRGYPYPPQAYYPPPDYGQPPGQRSRSSDSQDLAEYLHDCRRRVKTDPVSALEN
jgi:hypothetical protein